MVVPVAAVLVAGPCVAVGRFVAGGPASVAVVGWLVADLPSAAAASAVVASRLAAAVAAGTS